MRAPFPDGTRKAQAAHVPDEGGMWAPLVVRCCARQPNKLYATLVSRARLIQCVARWLGWCSAELLEKGGDVTGCCQQRTLRRYRDIGIPFVALWRDDDYVTRSNDERGIRSRHERRWPQSNRR